MESILKTLAVPIIASIIGGIIVGLVLGRVNAPETPKLVSTVKWIDFENPLFLADRKFLGDIQKGVESIWSGTAPIAGLLEVIRDKHELRLVEIEIKNSSNLRSQEIEITAPGAVFFFSQDADSTAQPSTSMKIKPLDPQGTARAIALTRPWFYRLSIPILALHGGKRIEAANLVVSEDEFEVLSYLREYPFLTGMAVISLAVMGLFLLVTIPVGIAAEYNPKLKAKLTSKGDLKKMERFLAYMRANHPEQFDLPPASAAS